MSEANHFLHLVCMTDNRGCAEVAVDEAIRRSHLMKSAMTVLWAQFVARQLDAFYGTRITSATYEEEWDSGRRGGLSLLVFQLDGREEEEFALLLDERLKKLTLRRALSKDHVVGLETTTTYDRIGPWLRDAMADSPIIGGWNTRVVFRDFDDRGILGVLGSCSLL